MIFKGLYDKCMRMAAHQHAERYLAGVSIIESIFFPIPTALMVAPMAVARPERAIRIALIATLTSAFGGLFGYALGYFAIDIIEPLLQEWGKWDKYLVAHEWFKEWGFWAVAIAGFTPLPFKVFTITAGALHMALIPFIVSALLGRAAHFFLVALLMAWAGPKLEPTVRKYIEWLGWGTLVLVAVLYFVYAH